MDRRWKGLVVIHIALMLAVLAAGCGPAATPLPPTRPPATATPMPPTPSQPQAQVFLAWIEAFNNKDVEAFMALVADDAVLDRGPHGVITGKETIRATLLEELKGNLRSTASQFVVEGDRVTYCYEVFEGGRRVDQGTGVAIVQNGKIKSDLPAK